MSTTQISFATLFACTKALVSKQHCSVAGAGAGSGSGSGSSNLPRNAITIARWVGLGIAVLMLNACTGSTHLSFLDPQGPIASAQQSHFYWMLGILLVMVAGPIFVLLPLFVWRYRYGSKKSQYAPRWAYSRLLEIMSWSGPIVIIIALSVFVWRDASRLDPYKALTSDQAPLEVEVIGYDWKWLFIYPEQGIATVGTLAIPSGRPISLHLTSATVMQSFFIPALGSQIYAMGGMVTQLHLEASQPGVSLGENTMYNGDGFHQQKFTAQALSARGFEAWVSKVRASGLPLDAARLQVVKQSGTRRDLIAALPGTQAMDGNVYFAPVSRGLFPAVVRATMDGRPVLPGSAFVQVGIPQTNTGINHLSPGQKR